MHSQLEQLKQKWQQLNSREQSLVAIMSVVVIVFLFYAAIWQPLNSNLAKSAKKLERRQALLTWVEQKTQLIKQLSRNKKATSASLTSIVNRSARQNNIVVTRMQPQGDDLQLWVDTVPFDTLLVWLTYLVEKQGLVIKALDISRGDDQGTVQVRRLQLGKN